jgi:hypothetical protein
MRQTRLKCNGGQNNAVLEDVLEGLFCERSNSLFLGVKNGAQREKAKAGFLMCRTAFFPFYIPENSGHSV